MEQNREKLLAFLKKYFPLDKADDDTNLFEMGFVNSLFTMQLIMFLETEFSITVDVADMDMQNFSSIGSMLAFIARKAGAAGPA